MPLFVAKRDLPGITPDALQSASAMRAKTCCAEMTFGRPARPLGPQLLSARIGSGPTATSKPPAAKPSKKPIPGPASPLPKSCPSWR